MAFSKFKAAPRKGAKRTVKELRRLVRAFSARLASL
jgi:hypothetical protein